MRLKLVNNKLVNFVSFYAYNVIHNTTINCNTSLIYADKEFGSFDRMLMRYTTKLYVVHLYRSKTKNKRVVQYTPSATSYFASIHEIEKLKAISMDKIEYIVIAERKESNFSDISKFVNNILYITNTSENISYTITSTEGTISYSSLDGINENHTTVEISLANETLGKDVDYSKYKETIEESDYNNKDKSPLGWLLYGDDCFYNILSAILVLVTLGIISAEVYYNGINNCYQMAIFSVITTIVFISILQYRKIYKKSK